MHDVAAHLVLPLEVSTPKFVVAMLVSRGSFDRGNLADPRAGGATLQRDRRALAPQGRHTVHPSRRRTRGTPHRRAGARPRHRLAARLTRQIPSERLQKSLTYLTSPPARSLVPKGVRQGLRSTAEDVDWGHGDGPLVSGSAEALLLALTGRAVALGHLHGDGLATLRSRLS